MRCALAGSLLLPGLLLAVAAQAQVQMLEPGFSITTLTGDLSKQIELKVGPDSCLYYGSFGGVKRRCALNTVEDVETTCDSTLTFPVGIAFGDGGAFGTDLYVTDYGVGGIHRAPGCSLTTPFAPVTDPGALALGPAGGPYAGYLYTCTAFSGPIDRVSPTGVVTPWVNLPTTYLKFGPGGVWGTELYANDYSGIGALARVSAAGAITNVIPSLFFPEGFDWAFDGDLFVTSPSAALVVRAHPDGSYTSFASIPGAADAAYVPSQDALYVVSNQGGLYRIARGGTTDAPPAALTAHESVSPNPARGACELRFALRHAGLERDDVLDASGRRVRTLPPVWTPAGPRTLHWDGRTADGSPARAGVYFLRSRTAGEQHAGRVTLVR